MCKRLDARRVPPRHCRHQGEHRSPRVTRHAGTTRRNPVGPRAARRGADASGRPDDPPPAGGRPGASRHGRIEPRDEEQPGPPATDVGPGGAARPVPAQRRQTPAADPSTRGRRACGTWSLSRIGRVSSSGSTPLGQPSSARARRRAPAVRAGRGGERRPGPPRDRAVSATAGERGGVGVRCRPGIGRRRRRGAGRGCPDADGRAGTTASSGARRRPTGGRRRRRGLRRGRAATDRRRLGGLRARAASGPTAPRKLGRLVGGLRRRAGRGQVGADHGQVADGRAAIGMRAVAAARPQRGARAARSGPPTSPACRARTRRERRLGGHREVPLRAAAARSRSVQAVSSTPPRTTRTHTWHEPLASCRQPSSSPAHQAPAW